MHTRNTRRIRNGAAVFMLLALWAPASCGTDGGSWEVDDAVSGNALCGSDFDCKGDRVCNAGRCTDPSPWVGGDDAQGSGDGGGGGVYEPLIYRGNFTVTSAGDLAVLQEYDEVDGSLTVGQGFDGDVYLPRLRRIGGTGFSCVLNNVHSIDIPILVEVDMMVSIHTCHKLTSISMPRLQAIHEVPVYSDDGDIDRYAADLMIGTNRLLRTLDLTGLRHVAAWFEVKRNDLLPSCLVQAYIGALERQPESVMVSDNRADCTCSDDSPPVATCGE